MPPRRTEVMIEEASTEAGTAESRPALRCEHSYSTPPYQESAGRARSALVAQAGEAAVETVEGRADGRLADRAVPDEGRAQHLEAVV